MLSYWFFWNRMRSFVGEVEDGGGSFGDGAPLPWCDRALCVFCPGLLLSLLPDSHVWRGVFSPQGAARNPEDMDRERREHEREERMGQLRGSATRALPPGPPAGATANRLRNVTEPMASTPTSRIQQSGEEGGSAGGGCHPCRWLETKTIDWYSCLDISLPQQATHPPEQSQEWTGSGRSAWGYTEELLPTSPHLTSQGGKKCHGFQHHRWTPAAVFLALAWMSQKVYRPQSSFCLICWSWRELEASGVVRGVVPSYTLALLFGIFWRPCSVLPF